jgi:hypothetical protein
MPVSGAEYQKLLKREQNRYPNDRDKAVRSANVAAGYGSSTALKHRDGGAGGADAKPKPKAKDSPAGSKPKAKAGASSPFKLPSKAPAPTPRPGGAAAAPVPTPTPRPTQFPPDLAVSPSPAQPNSQVGPTNAAQPFGNDIPPGVANFTPQMNPAMSQASVLQTIPPELQAILAPPGGGFAGQETAPGLPAPQFAGAGRDALAAMSTFPGRQPAPTDNSGGLMAPIGGLPGTAGANTIQGQSIFDLLRSMRGMGG